MVCLHRKFLNLNLKFFRFPPDSVKSSVGSSVPCLKRKRTSARKRKSFFLILYVFLQSGPADAL